MGVTADRGKIKHKAEMLYPLTSFQDSTPTLEEMLSTGEFWPEVLLCQMKCDFVGDAHTMQDMVSTQQEFNAAEGKKGNCKYCDTREVRGFEGRREFIMVLLDTKRPWWMHRPVFWLAVVLFLGLPYCRYLYSKVRKVELGVRKTFKRADIEEARWEAQESKAPMREPTKPGAMTGRVFLEQERPAPFLYCAYIFGVLALIIFLIGAIVCLVMGNWYYAIFICPEALFMYLMYVASFIRGSKVAKYLANAATTKEFNGYIEEVQNAAPQITFIVECFDDIVPSSE